MEDGDLLQQVDANGRRSRLRAPLIREVEERQPIPRIRGKSLQERPPRRHRLLHPVHAHEAERTVAACREGNHEAAEVEMVFLQNGMTCRHGLLLAFDPGRRVRFLRARLDSTPPTEADTAGNGFPPSGIAHQRKRGTATRLLTSRGGWPVKLLSG